MGRSNMPDDQKTAPCPNRFAQSCLNDNEPRRAHCRKRERLRPIRARFALGRGRSRLVPAGRIVARFSPLTLTDPAFSDPWARGDGLQAGIRCKSSGTCGPLYVCLVGGVPQSLARRGAARRAEPLPVSGGGCGGVGGCAGRGCGAGCSSGGWRACMGRARRGSRALCRCGVGVDAGGRAGGVCRSR
jgi:hypothetical protein